MVARIIFIHPFFSSSGSSPVKSSISFARPHATIPFSTFSAASRSCFSSNRVEGRGIDVFPGLVGVGLQIGQRHFVKPAVHESFRCRHNVPLSVQEKRSTPDGTNQTMHRMYVQVSTVREIFKKSSAKSEPNRMHANKTPWATTARQLLRDNRRCRFPAAARQSL